MSGMHKARSQRLAGWAEGLGETGCREFLGAARAKLVAASKGRRHSSGAASGLQAQMAACRRFLRQMGNRGNRSPEQGKEMNEEARQSPRGDPAWRAGGDSGGGTGAGGGRSRDPDLARLDARLSLSPDLQAMLDAGRQVSRALYEQTGPQG